MRKIKEVLRLRFEQGQSYARIAGSISVATSTVADYLARARAAGLQWPLEAGMDDGIVEGRLYPSVVAAGKRLLMPDFEYVYRELRRKGVTLALLWQEYKQAHPDDGYQYSQYCELYNRFCGQVDVVMRQHHRAGEKMFVDFSGDGIPVVDPIGGQAREAALFLAVLGASNYTYAEAFESQKLPCWINGHIHAFEYFRGVPAVVVPDNPKSLIKDPCYYEPDINATYLDMSRHYGTVVLPARVRKPRDKAKVETAVLLAQRWILAALRNQNFFSLTAANMAIRQKLEELNSRKFQKLEGSRKQLWETLDRPALKPLPPGRYEFAEWLRTRVNVDYHVEVDKHFYSVPYQLVQKEVEVRKNAVIVEMLYKGQRVASHTYSSVKGGYSTKPEHMPKAHQQYLQWSPSRILQWAAKAGPNTAAVAEKILASRSHPELGYRGCLGLIRLGKTHTNERLEAACGRAISIGACSYKSVKSILQNGLDRQMPAAGATAQLRLPIEHENLRGADYYN